MHPDVAAALNWSNSSSRKKLIARLYAAGVVSQRDCTNAASVIRIRIAMAQAGSNMAVQEKALRGLKQNLGVSNTQLKRLCKLSKVCLADGKWYPDLAERLTMPEYRVYRRHIKGNYELLKFCMLHARHRPVG